MDQHYGADYDRLIGNAGETSPERWRARQAAISQYKSGGALLDIGCSSGAFLESLRGPAWQLYGIEISADTARKAEARTGAQVFVGDVSEAPFAPASFDVVTCFDVLEHVHEPRKVLASVHKWLKPGGIFYTLVPNIDSGEARIFRSYWYGLELPRHISHFSPTSLRNMAASVGLREVSLQTRPNSALERSVRYICDEIVQRIGFSRRPLATAKPVGLPWKVIRKMLRVSVLPFTYRLVCLKGDGESIHAVFEKPTSRIPPA